MIIRDYKEAVIRHAAASRKIENVDEINKCLEGYIHCLQSYDEFDGEKIIIYYEDLMISPKEEVAKLMSFLEIDEREMFDAFFKKYSQHKQKSIRGYKPGSMTKGNPGKWHTNKASAKINSLINRKIKVHKDLYKRYLKRYN